MEFRQIDYLTTAQSVRGCRPTLSRYYVNPVPVQWSKNLECSAGVCPKLLPRTRRTRIVVTCPLPVAPRRQRLNKVGHLGYRMNITPVFIVHTRLSWFARVNQRYKLLHERWRTCRSTCPSMSFGGTDDSLCLRPCRIAPITVGRTSLLASQHVLRLGTCTESCARVSFSFARRVPKMVSQSVRRERYE